MKNVVVGQSSCVTAAQMKDFWRQIDDGSITKESFQSFLHRKSEPTSPDAYTPSWPVEGGVLKIRGYSVVFGFKDKRTGIAVNLQFRWPEAPENNGYAFGEAVLDKTTEKQIVRGYRSGNLTEFWAKDRGEEREPIIYVADQLPTDLLGSDKWFDDGSALIMWQRFGDKTRTQCVTCLLPGEKIEEVPPFITYRTQCKGEDLPHPFAVFLEIGNAQTWIVPVELTMQKYGHIIRSCVVSRV